MKINMLKNSHFLVLFTTTAFGSKLKAYRSTLITDQPPDLFAFFDDEALQKPPMLFNKKLQQIPKEITGVTTTYEPFVSIDKNENGTKLYSGFESDILKLI